MPENDRPEIKEQIKGSSDQKKTLGVRSLKFMFGPSLS